MKSSCLLLACLATWTASACMAPERRQSSEPALPPEQAPVAALHPPPAPLPQETPREPAPTAPGASGGRWQTVEPPPEGQVGAATLQNTGITEAHGTAALSATPKGSTLSVDLFRTMSGPLTLRLLDACAAPPEGLAACEPGGPGFVGGVEVGSDGMGHGTFETSQPAEAVIGRALALYGVVAAPTATVTSSREAACRAIACGTIGTGS